MTPYPHQSTWLPKPVYKQIRFFSAIVLALLFVLGFTASGFWTAGLVYTGCWFVVTGLAAFHLRSGYFVPAATRLSGTENVVCITFDDGPCAQTARILDTLKRENVRATFFCVGQQVERYPHIARRIVDEGHTLGNHSFSHGAVLPLKGANAIRKEIRDTQATIARATGRVPRFFRPPFGVTNPMIATALTGLGLTSVGWSVRSLDTVYRRRARVLARMEKRLQPGSIILLHDQVEGAAELLSAVIRLCRSKDLAPVSLDEAYEGYLHLPQNSAQFGDFEVALNRSGA